MKYHEDIVLLFEEINSPNFIECETFLKKSDSVKNSVFFFDQNSLSLAGINDSKKDDDREKMFEALDINFKKDNIAMTKVNGVQYRVLSFQNMVDIVLSDRDEFTGAVHSVAEVLLYHHAHGLKNYMTSDVFLRFKKAKKHSESFIKDTLPSQESKYGTRVDIIQSVIDKIGATRYLEVGVHSFTNFSKIKCSQKVAVDPKPRYKKYNKLDNELVIEKTSDEFFSDDNIEKFDVVFLDGFHEASQLKRDIDNSLNNLSENGIIVCHDCNPMGYLQQAFPPMSNGDCWRAFAGIVSDRDDLNAFVINCDHGVGIIKKKNYTKEEISYKISNLTFDEFEKGKREILNLCEYPEFDRWVDSLL